MTDDLVFNCLVDIANIEFIALSSSKEESECTLLARDNNEKECIRDRILHISFFV